MSWQGLLRTRRGGAARRPASKQHQQRWSPLPGKTTDVRPSIRDASPCRRFKPWLDGLRPVGLRPLRWLRLRRRHGVWGRRGLRSRGALRFGLWLRRRARLRLRGRRLRRWPLVRRPEVDRRLRLRRTQVVLLHERRRRLRVRRWVRIVRRAGMRMRRRCLRRRPVRRCGLCDGARLQVRADLRCEPLPLRTLPDQACR